jgi:hypothetical protein
MGLNATLPDAGVVRPAVGAFGISRTKPSHLRGAKTVSKSLSELTPRTRTCSPKWVTRRAAVSSLSLT